MLTTVRIGDVFHSACPTCSPSGAVPHAVRKVRRKGGKFAADAHCLRPACYRYVTGSLDPTDGKLYVTWLDYHGDRKPDRVKTEEFAELAHDSDWEERFTLPPSLSKDRRKLILDGIADLLSQSRYTRKRQLETALAELFPEFAAVNLSDRNDIRLAFPETSGLLKELRIEGRVKFALDRGHHVFGTGRVVTDGSAHSARLAWQRLHAHRIKPGPVQVSLVFYLPVGDAGHLDHFLQAVFPSASIGTPFHRIVLACGYKERKAQTAAFRTGDLECDLTLAPHRMTVTAGLLERDLAVSLTKLLLMGNVIAREVVCAANAPHLVLSLKNRPTFPATVLVHNQLPHSEALWRTEYTNLHRSFHGFPEFDPKEDRSVSKRLILSHGTRGPAEFPGELVEEHLAKFRMAFLREYVDYLGSADEYVPPSILRAYAPAGEAADKLVADLTTIYEERLKKAALDRQKSEQRVKGFIARTNFWQSLIVLLFSIAAVTDVKPLTWVIAGLSLLFVAYLFWETVWRKQLKHEEAREGW